MYFKIMVLSVLALIFFLLVYILFDFHMFLLFYSDEYESRNLKVSKRLDSQKVDM